MTPLTPYQLELAKNMAEALKGARTSGATMLTMQGLMKITKMPNNFLEGSPRGWKAFNTALDGIMESLDKPAGNNHHLKTLADQFA